MKTNKDIQDIEASLEGVTETAMIVPEAQSLDKPQRDTEFAKVAADFLVDIIKKNNWSRKLGGQSEHIQYEGWQTAGKYYGYSVKTHDAEYIELGGTWGFKAKATVINENTGIEIGSAEAYCMSDENNWRSKPKFQLASMAQTRAGSKALRQILGFVVALAGYNPTPAEEMEDVQPIVHHTQPTATQQNGNGHDMSEKQAGLIERLAEQKGKTEKALNATAQGYGVGSWRELTKKDASDFIEKLMALPSK
jgi:hypothetical protein